MASLSSRCRRNCRAPATGRATEATAWIGCEINQRVASRVPRHTGLCAAADATARLRGVGRLLATGAQRVIVLVIYLHTLRGGAV
jgi:hypothetical protein